MTWLFAVLVVLALGAVAVVASGRYGGALPPAYDDRPDVVLPQTRLRGDDLRGVRLPLALRGYRMEEVDALLARVAAELDDARGEGTRGGDQAG